MLAEGVDDAVDVGDLESGVCGVLVVDELRLHCSGGIAETSNTSAGIVCGAPFAKDVLIVGCQAGVADENHLGAIRKFVIDLL